MKKAAWLIPSFIEGSGGYRTIFQHVNYMATSFECDIYVYNSGDYKSNQELAQRAECLYGKCKCQFYLGYDIRSDKEYDIILATSWLTANAVYLYSGKAKKVYFVQDYEPLFYPVGDKYIEAANTYELGFNHITIGRWLAWKLKSVHMANAQYFDFCANKMIYYKNANSNREKAICFIYQPEKSRRCTQLGMEALFIVKKIIPDVVIYLYGSNEKKGLPIDCISKGIISPEKCNELYNLCQVGLCISATNPSRIPFEMMSAGLPVVDIYKENNLFDYQDGSVLLAQGRPEAIAQAIINILINAELQKRMSENGQKFMRNRDVEIGMHQFEKAIGACIDSDNINEKNISKMYEGLPVIPSKELLEKCKEIYLNEKYRRETKVNRIKKNRLLRKIPGIKKLGKLLNIE